ncbi:MAG: SPOR domain-containing protein [bacterium]
MKYLALILIIIIVSILGYFAGQYFYKEKINVTKDTSKPLISPLIEEKKYIENTINTQPLIIIPTTIENKTIKKEKTKQTMQTTIQNTLQTTTETTIQNDTETNEKTELTEDTKLTKNIKENTKENTNENTNENINETTNEYQESNTGLYYIQVGSFSSLENAELVKKQLESLGLNPKIEQVISGNNVVYRVIIGNYKTQEEALEESNKLKRMGFDNIVKNY